jgi:hypothetical protein
MLFKTYCSTLNVVLMMVLMFDVFNIENAKLKSKVNIEKKDKKINERTIIIWLLLFHLFEISL